MESKEINSVTPDFQKTVQELIDNLRVERFSDAEEYRLAHEYSALPMGVDMWSYVLLTANGEIIDQDYDGNFQHHRVDSQALIRVLVAGKRRYPQLAKFIPNRSDQSKTCPICEGSGIWEQSKDVATEKPGKCFICAGLGWVTEETYSEIQKNSK
ncbi:MAG TPA: hypothetical protein VK892_17300 [Pyrinomonadaceae bacterium]|nr:hypothetical protein [Pyrinomonadaceae bacterium]